MPVSIEALRMPDDEDEIAANLKRFRENILMVLLRYGDVPTGELRTKSQIPRGSKSHHLGVLDDWGLIEVTDRTDRGVADNTERVWTLTDIGERFVARHLTDDDGQPDNHEIRIQGLEEQVEQQRREIEELRAALDGQAQDTKEIREKLEDDYWNAIIEAIDARTSDKAED